MYVKMIAIQFFLDIATVVLNGQDCCCDGCPICTHCDNGCVTDPAQIGDVAGSITDGYGTRDLYCCNGNPTDFDYDDGNCGNCGVNCAAGGQFCCAGSCVGSPC